MKDKITIIGSGHVGSHCGLLLAINNICEEIVLVDKIPEKANSQALDISDAIYGSNSKTKVRMGTLEDCSTSKIIIIAIGKPREAGQTRLDMFDDSILMAKDLIKDLNKLEINGIIITITNPADIIAHLFSSKLNLPKNKVFGTGTLLDTVRLRRILSEKTGVRGENISCIVLGEHGDSSVVAFSHIKINNKNFENYNLDYENITYETRYSGMEIVEGKGSTEFGIGQVIANLCRTIITNENAIYPLSASLTGEYSLENISIGVPCQVNKEGIVKVLEIPLSKDEEIAFLNSSSIIKDYISKI